MGAIIPGSLSLDIDPMDSPLWVLDGVGDPMITTGYSILVELTAMNKTTMLTETLRFGTDGYSDVSGPGYFSPRMVQSLNFRRDMFDGNTTSGKGKVSFGEMRLANDDGGLDMLRTTYAFAGWPAILWIGDSTLTFDTFERLLTGKPQQVFFSYKDLSISLRDRLEDFQNPMQEHNYLGNNILPNGLEGSDDLKDKPKPLLYGRVQNITPIFVNTAKLIWQVNDGPVERLSAVYDRGAALTRGADYASSADMMATQPTPGTFRCWMAGGYFRLGATPSGSITCDAADKWLLSGTELDIGNTAAQVASRIATHTGNGIPPTDISSGDVVALDLLNTATVGIWFADLTTFGSALDAILGSVGAAYGFDRIDKFRMSRLDNPTGPGVCTFKSFGPSVDAAINEFDIMDVRFLPTNDSDKGIPSWQVNVEWGVNYTVQSVDDLAGFVPPERQNFLELAFRTATATDATVQTAYPLAKEKTINTVLYDGTAAQAEANRLLGMFKIQHDFIELDTPLTSEIIATVDVGNTVQVILSRFNYQMGKSMRVIGMQYNPNVRGLTLSLWG